MGQPNAKRIQYEHIQALTSSLNDDRQTLNQTGCLEVGDVLEFYDQDAAGCLGALIGTRTITAICPNEAIVLDSAIDLTVVTGTAAIRDRTIDDVKVILDRYCSKIYQADDYKIDWAPAILASDVDTPIVGQSRHEVIDATCFAAGDTWQIVSDEGLAGSGTVVSIDPALNDVVIDDSIDAFGSLTNPKLINTSVTLKQQLFRLKSLIDQTGSPVSEQLDDGDCNNTAFEVSQKFVGASSQVYLDGVLKRRGTCGTLATLSNGAGAAEVILTSLVLGLDGNDIDFEMLDPAGASQPLAITVSGTYDGADRKVSVSLETDGGSTLVSTAQEVVDAINADADAKRLVLAQYGGDGTGVQAALVATPLAGGLNDGTGDYCELEQVDGNGISGTGYRWISFHIRPDEANRMSEPPVDSEELDIIYAKAV